MSVFTNIENVHTLTPQEFLSLNVYPRETVCYVHEEVQSMRFVASLFVTGKIGSNIIEE